jgi:hypothetical protein
MREEKENRTKKKTHRRRRRRTFDWRCSSLLHIHLVWKKKHQQRYHKATAEKGEHC